MIVLLRVLIQLTKKTSEKTNEKGKKPDDTEKVGDIAAQFIKKYFAERVVRESAINADGASS